MVTRSVEISPSGTYISAREGMGVARLDGWHDIASGEFPANTQCDLVSTFKINSSSNNDIFTTSEIYVDIQDGSSQTGWTTVYSWTSAGHESTPGKWNVPTNRWVTVRSFGRQAASGYPQSAFFTPGTSGVVHYRIGVRLSGSLEGEDIEFITDSITVDICASPCRLDGIIITDVRPVLQSGKWYVHADMYNNIGDATTRTYFTVRFELFDDWSGEMMDYSPCPSMTSSCMTSLDGLYGRITTVVSEPIPLSPFPQQVWVSVRPQLGSTSRVIQVELPSSGIDVSGLVVSGIQLTQGYGDLINGTPVNALVTVSNNGTVTKSSGWTVRLGVYGESGGAKSTYASAPQSALAPGRSVSIPIGVYLQQSKSAEMFNIFGWVV